MEKLYKNYLLLITLVLIYNQVEANEENKKSNYDEYTFVPSSDWQVVKKGQKIPRGLHVRINLETGMTEAKLMDESGKKHDSALVEVPNTPDVDNSFDAGSIKDSTKNPKFLPSNVIKEALKNIKSDDPKLHSKYEKQIKNKFRSYDELKKDLEDINLKPKSDMEILKALLENYDKVMDSKDGEFRKDTEVLQILEHIDYLVHQYDNAIEFVALNGFNKLIYKNLNSSNSEIKRETLKLMGSCVQNNAKVQIHALETGSVNVLLRILALDSDYGVKLRAVFALSGLLRHFPLAQLKFVENAGLSVFSNLFKKSEDTKIQIKIVTLVNDMILEHNEASRDTRSINYEDKLNQYFQVNVYTKLSQHNWCDNLSKLLINVIAVDEFDHDSIEKCLLAINSVKDICSSDFSLKITDILNYLRKQYLKLSHMETDDEDIIEESDYYLRLYNFCKTILNTLGIKHKTEL